MCAIPFGFAVVPDVYIRKSRSSASIGSGGQRGGVVGDVELVQPDVAARLHRHLVAGAADDEAALGSPARRPSPRRRSASSGTVVPRRHASSWVTSTSQPMSFARSESESAEKPPKTTVCGAPSRVQASIATGSSGTIPM